MYQWNELPIIILRGTVAHSVINNENNHIDNSGWIQKPDFKQCSPAFVFHVQR